MTDETEYALVISRLQQELREETDWMAEPTEDTLRTMMIFTWNSKP